MLGKERKEVRQIQKVKNNPSISSSIFKKQTSQYTEELPGVMVYAL